MIGPVRRYQSSTIAGSPLYMAPEQLAGSYLTTKVAGRPRGAAAASRDRCRHSRRRAARAFGSRS